MDKVAENMMMLGFNPIRHLKGPYESIKIDKFTFTTGLNQLRAVEIILHFLITRSEHPDIPYKFNPSVCVSNDIFASCWPIVDAHTAKEFRMAAFKWIEEKRKAGLLGSDVTIRKSSLDDCNGTKFENLLLSISNYAVMLCFREKAEKVLENIQKDCKDLNVKQVAEKLGKTQIEIEKLKTSFGTQLDEKKIKLKSIKANIDSIRRSMTYEPQVNRDNYENLTLIELERMRDEMFELVDSSNVNWRVLNMSSTEEPSTTETWKRYQEWKGVVNKTNDNDLSRMPSMNSFLDAQTRIQTKRLDLLVELGQELVQKLVIETDKIKKLTFETAKIKSNSVIQKKSESKNVPIPFLDLSFYQEPEDEPSMQVIHFPTTFDGLNHTSVKDYIRKQVEQEANRRFKALQDVTLDSPSAQNVVKTITFSSSLNSPANIANLSNGKESTEMITDRKLLSPVSPNLLSPRREKSSPKGKRRIETPLRQQVLLKAALAHETPEGVKPKVEFGFFRKRMAIPIKKEKDEIQVKLPGSPRTTIAQRSIPARATLSRQYQDKENANAKLFTPQRPIVSFNRTPGFKTVIRKNAAPDIFDEVLPDNFDLSTTININDARELFSGL